MSVNKTERYQYGYKIMKEHLGDATDAWLKKLEKAELFVRVNVECAFGDIYGDPQSSLNDKTREMITIAALTVQGLSMAAFKVHIVSSLNVGVKPQEIIDIITQMIAYCGFPAATQAMVAALEVMEERGVI